jgi:hypothetical protein
VLSDAKVYDDGVTLSSRRRIGREMGGGGGAYFGCGGGGGGDDDDVFFCEDELSLRGVGVNLGSLGTGRWRCSCTTYGYVNAAGCRSCHVEGRESCTLNESLRRLPLPARGGIGPPRTPLMMPFVSISNGSSAM